MLMSFELMLNTVTLNLVAFDAWRVDGLATGQTLAVFVITIAAADGLGLAIVLLLLRAPAMSTPTPPATCWNRTPTVARPRC